MSAVKTLKIYEETGGCVSGVDERGRWMSSYTERYTQPRWRHALARAYHWYDMHSHRLPIWGVLERISKWRHHFICDNNCATFYVSGTDEEVPDCARLPLLVRQDLRCYDMSHRKRTRVSVEYGKREYNTREENA